MNFYELGNVVLVMLLIGGLYLPYVRNVVKNNFVLGIFLLLVIIPIIASPIYALLMTLPLVYRDSPTILRLFLVMAGSSCWSTIFKMFSFYYHQKHFEHLIRLWDALSENALYPKLRQEILLKTKKMTNRWIISFEILLTSSGALFSGIQFYTRKLEHPTALNYSTASPEFDILVTYDFIATVYMCMLLHAYNSLFMQTVAFEEASCEYLRKSLGIIFDSFRVDDEGSIYVRGNNRYREEKDSRSNNVVLYREVTYNAERELRIWVQQHQKLIKFHNKLQEIYNIPLCIEFTSVVIIICIISFMIITNSMTPIMTFICISYCISAYTILYVSCSYGDWTAIESTSLHEDAFGNNWFLYPKSLQKNLLFIILRCNKPMDLRAFKLYPLNSSSFARIFRHSYSFFMFILQVMSRSKA